MSILSALASMGASSLRAAQPSAERKAAAAARNVLESEPAGETESELTALLTDETESEPDGLLTDETESELTGPLTGETESELTGLLTHETESELNGLQANETEDEAPFDPLIRLVMEQVQRTAGTLQEGILAAAHQLRIDQQMAELQASLDQTHFLLTGETPAHDEESEEIPEETETELIPETEAETEAETEIMIQAWPTEIGVETDPASEGPNARPRHGVLDIPQLQNMNSARISLYDYRMLREWPLPALPKDMHRLYDQLKALVGTFDGTWSVYAQNLSTNQALIINDSPMRSASVMKLFIMEAVYEAFDKGTLERNEDTVYLLRSMIINSSNSSSNRLLTLLGGDNFAAGIDVVNDFIRRHGFNHNTAIYNGFEDPATVINPGVSNSIMAKDVGLLLSRVYNREFLSRRVCNEIESMMLEQATRYKIPSGVPDGVEVGNKSGETSSVANDAAVIYGQTADYILVVLSEDWGNEGSANDNIVTVSRAVYDFFEN